MKSIGIIVGRFQIDEVHEGHLMLIDYVVKKNDYTVIFLGVPATPPNSKHPLDYQTRELMVKKYAPEAIVVPIMDCPSDMQWSINLDNMIRSFNFGETAKVTLYGGRDSFFTYYKGNFQTESLNFPLDDSINATEARKKIGIKPVDSSDFRAGVIYATQNFIRRTYVTVDIAMLDRNIGLQGDAAVLMGKKSGEELWRLPGGFVDFKDENIEAAARREFFEETGMPVEGELTYLGSFPIDDWRNTDDARIVTCLFTTKYCWGQAKAGDDLEETCWMNLEKKHLELVYKPHRKLFEHLILKEG